MLGFIPTTAPATADERIEGTAYAHPAPALAEAQRLAADRDNPGLSDYATGTVALLAIVVYPDGEFGRCCPTCFVAEGELHDDACAARGPVLPTSAVVRPIGEVRGAGLS